MEFRFTTVPESKDALLALPEFGFSSPHQVSALLLLALMNFEKNREECYAMIDALKGPQKLSPMDKSFIRDRMMGKADYIAKAYFLGATPENNYTPNEPLSIRVEENDYSYSDPGYARLLIRTAGADSPRTLTLRQKGEEWFVWEFPGLLADIRKPKEADPWA